MNITQITKQEIKHGYLVRTIIKSGINKWFTTNFFKTKEESDKFAKELEDHEKDWNEYYYMIASPIMQTNRHEDKWCTNLKITQVLYKKDTTSTC